MKSKIIKISCLFFVALFLLSACASKNAIVSEPEKIVLAYVTSGGRNLPDPAHITHINYAFGRVNEEFNGITVRNEERLMAIAGLKQQKPSLKILLSIGGAGAGGFSEMASTVATRLAFAADCKRVIDQFNLDGIDMDWEYPSQDSRGRISASPEDIDNFTFLMRDIRAAIGNDKLLTFASVSSAQYVDFKAVNPYLDFVNIMTYDMGSPPYHQSGLYRSEFTRRISTEESVFLHVEAGIPINKLTLGIPFYGRHGLPREPGRDNAVIYRTIVSDWLTNPAYTEKWDDIAKVPYLVDAEGTFILNYDNPRSIAEKCKFVHEKGLLGAMYWQYDQDDENSSLRWAVYNGIMNK